MMDIVYDEMMMIMIQMKKNQNLHHINIIVDFTYLTQNEISSYNLLSVT